MASPADATHPLTPPAETLQPTQTATQSQTRANSPSTAANNTANPAAAARAEVLLSQPLTSLDDNGTSKRPRDHRLIHLLLASHGIQAYQERVPLQLMDFAYRYTSSVLSDALHIQSEGYDHADTATAANAAGGGAAGSTSGTGKGSGRGKAHNKNNEDGDVSLSALRFSIGSRTGYSFAGSLPKEFLKQLADERNRISLATHSRDIERGGAMVDGVKLPHERYCLTGVGWGLKEYWESEGEESADDADGTTNNNGAGNVTNGINGTQSTSQRNGNNGGDSMQIDGQDGNDEEMEEDEEGAGNIEDVFGADEGDDGGGGNAKDSDAIMRDS